MSDQLNANPEPVIEALTPAAPDAPAVDEAAELEATWERLMGGQERDEAGKFKGEEASEAPAEEAEAKAPEEKAEEPAPPEVPAPEHLPQAIKSDWANIPENARKAIVDHQREMDRKFGEVGHQLRSAKPFIDRLSQVKHIPELADLSHEQIAQGALELAAVQVSLEKDPMNTLVQIAQTYGVLDQFRAFVTGEQAPQGGQQNQQMAATIRQMQKTIDELRNPEYIEQNVSRYMDDRDTRNLVSDLTKGKEHYAEVEASMPAFIEMAWAQLGEAASKSDVFDTAYDMAIHAHPTVRAKVGAAAKAAPQPDPKRAESAKKAASINVKSTSSGRERSVTEEEAMASAYDRAMAH